MFTPVVMPGHDRDRELESLRAVDGEDAHRIVVGLREDGLHDARAFRALEVGPAQEVAQTAAGPASRHRTGGLGERAGLVDDEPDPAPEIARALVRERDLEHAALAHDAVEELTRPEPQARVVPRGERTHRLGDRVVVRQRLGQRCLVVPVTAVVDAERVEVVVAAAEQRRAQRARRATARRWGRRRLGAPSGGRGSRGCRRPATTSRPGRGCRRHRARPRAAPATCAREEDRDVTQPARLPGFVTVRVLA